MSWKIAFVADNSGHWVTNGMRFASKEEAEANVADLAMPWTMVTDTAVEVRRSRQLSLGRRQAGAGKSQLQILWRRTEKRPAQDNEFTCWCHQCNVKRTAQPPTQQSLAL